MRLTYAEDGLVLDRGVHFRNPERMSDAEAPFRRYNIGSAISSLFTPSGTNQRERQVDQQSGYATDAYNSLWPGVKNYLQTAQSFQNSQYPNVEQGAQNAYYNTTQGGRNAQTNAYGDQQRAMANEQASQAGSRFAGNPSLAQGYGLAASNTANQNTGNYSAGLNSPQGEMGAWANYANSLQSAAPNYSNLGAFNSTIYGQPQVPVDQGLGSILGSLVGPAIAGASGNPLAFLGMGSPSGSVSLGTANNNTPSSGGYGYMDPSTISALAQILGGGYR